MEGEITEKTVITLSKINFYIFSLLHHIPDGNRIEQPVRKYKRDKIMVVIATGIHLFPFRTEKLSPLAPMVLLYQVGE